jgi:hypothetical protein
MLDANQIRRLLDSKEFSQLIDRILMNGRCRSSLTRQMLRKKDVAVVSAIGLGLQRIIELTYRPTPMADALAKQVMDFQDQRGLFRTGMTANGSGGERRCAAAPFATSTCGQDFTVGVLGASAVALRGLIGWRRQHETNRAFNNLEGSDVIQRGLDGIAGLFEIQKESGDWLQYAIDWAIVLWQLGDIEAFRAAVPIDELLDLLDSARAELSDDELCRYAHAVAA